MMKKLGTLLLALLLLISVIGMTAAVPEEPSDRPSELRENPLEPGRPNRGQEAPKKTTRGKSLPAYYSSADLGYVTAVRDQTPYGTCWAHTVAAACETNMIMNQIPVRDAAATTELDLSELHLSYFTYSDARDALGMLKGCGTYVSDSYLDHGGNAKMASYTLMRWEGLADESLDALKYTSASAAGLASSYAYLHNVAHVRSCYWVNANQPEKVKQGVMDFGAGTVSFHYDGAYEKVENGAYYCPDADVLNHSVTIIGWDDNYSRANFALTPEGDGAWICKNSWGAGSGNGGYLYISFYDQSIKWGYDDVCFFEVDPIGRYDNNYQYDGSCNDVDSCSLENAPFGGKAANVFTATGNELLKAVAFNPVYDWSAYRLEVFLNPAMDAPDSGTPVFSTERSVEYAGYYTIELDSPLRLFAGDTFSVVITNIGDSTLCIGTDRNGQTEYPNSSAVTHVHAAHPHTSYLRSGNGPWQDTSSTESFRIKAFSVDVLNETGFRDVAENAWYYDSVLYAVKHQLMNGMSARRFEPEGTMTRAMLVTVLWRNAGSPSSSYRHGFADVSEADWFADAVTWAAEQGVVNGMSETTFAPNLGINREQLATILYRYADGTARGDLQAFPDGEQVSQWAWDAMCWCVAEGIIGGSDGLLLPQGNATRAQVATILMRFLEKSQA